MADKFYPCQCCGFLTLSDPQIGSYEICPVCYWEDDAVQAEDPTYAGGANRVCLNDARKNFVRFGACEEVSIPRVRAPKLDEYSLSTSLYGCEEELAASLKWRAKVQMLSLVRSMLSGGVGFAIGSMYISHLVRKLSEPELLNALTPFRVVASEVDCLPLGEERQFWNPESLARQDSILADFERSIRDKMLPDCRAAESLLIADLLRE
jgi:hypothetical protein